jgi:hypothetical protein
MTGMRLSQRIQAMTLREGVLLWLTAIALGLGIRAMGHNWATPLLGLPADFWRGFLQTVAVFPPVVAVVVPFVLGSGITVRPPKA